MLVLLNPHAAGGTAIRKWERIKTRLNLASNNFYSYYTTIKSLSKDLILDAVNSGKTDFVIAGGDGTINEFLNNLIECSEPEILNDIRIGAVGIGSSNDFHKPVQSKNLIDNIPVRINFKEAMKHDVGCIIYENGSGIGKKYFLINSSIGVTAEANNFFNNPDAILYLLKKIKTQAAINYAAIKTIKDYKNFEAVICNGLDEIQTQITTMGITKSAFFSGKLRYSSDPLPNNGLFDIHLYEDLSKKELLKLFLNMSKNKPDIYRNKKFWRTDCLKISSKKKFAVEYDGEVITTNTVEYCILPRFIKVCVN